MIISFNCIFTHPAITCSKLTIETWEQGVKYVQINNEDTRTTPVSVVNFEHVNAGWVRSILFFTWILIRKKKNSLIHLVDLTTLTQEQTYARTFFFSNTAQINFWFWCILNFTVIHKSSACGTYFYMNFQFMTTKTHCRQKTFSPASTKICRWMPPLLLTKS